MSSYVEVHENRGMAREIKFLVTPERAGQIREWARSRLDPDPHAGGATGDVYRITSLYFDTGEYDVLRRTGSFGRAKYRIRRYNDSPLVFMERKLRSGKMLTKRRTIVPVEELERLTAGGLDTDWAGYWFQRRILVRQLVPVCQISYARTARVAETPYGQIRLTLDDDLRAQPAAEFVFGDLRAAGKIVDGSVVVEMKYRREMPAVFQSLQEEFGISPQPLSKYRIAATALGCCPASAALSDSGRDGASASLISGAGVSSADAPATPGD